MTFEDLLNDEPYKSCYEKGFADGKAKGMADATRWIPVTERLPEENNEYLVTIGGLENNLNDIAYYAKDLYKIDKYDFADLKRKSGFYQYSSECGYYLVSDVLAWMPLPEPYKKEGAEE